MISACLVYILLLVGCATTPTPIKNQEYTTPASAKQRAADTLILADSAQSPERDKLLSETANLLLEAGDTKAAFETYSHVNGATLSEQTLARYTLNYTSLAIERDEFLLARNLLNQPSLERERVLWPASQQIQLLQLRGDLFALLGETSASITAYTQLTQINDDPSTAQFIHDTIWQILGHTSDQHVFELSNAANTRTLKGWYQLALVSRREQSNLRRHQLAVEAWQQEWSDHPAAQLLPTFFVRSATTTLVAPKKIALLLPLQGDYALAAGTIRDGVMAALFRAQQNGVRPPKVEIYDTMAEDTLTLYQRAVNNGAGAVIGPLRRDQLTVLAQQSELPVPLIGLNYLEDQSNPLPANFYQFGLSVIDEARQVARRAWIEGHRNALVLVPKTTWGQKALDVFEQDFNLNGGRVAGAAKYGTGVKDFSPIIRSLLHVDQSNARINNLKRTLGKNLKTTQNRRQDVDMIFLIAYPTQGRQIKPTLDFFYAKNLPVYATSHIYSGIEDPGRDNDLDTIRFITMPWTLDANTDLRPGEDVPPTFSHFFALGADAYQLHQWVIIMNSLEKATFSGYTGTLTIQADNRIRREQPWAKFRNGKAVPQTFFRNDE